MSDEIVVIAPKDLSECKALSKDLALSTLLPQALRKKPEDVLAIVLTGAELGLAPMQAVRGIHIINGRASLSADLMGALVKRSPVCEYLQLAESTGAVATYKTRRRGDPGETTLSFTIEQAKAAGLSGDNWRKYPDAMLRARCLSAICRAVYPDLCVGIYDSQTEEIEPDEPRDITPQRAHVDAFKQQLRGEVVEGKIAPEPFDALKTAIGCAGNVEQLQALIPQLKALSEEDRRAIKPVYEARKVALTEGAV